MPKDTRYATIKILIAAGHIKSFRDIFQHIPKSVVYGDLGVNFERFTKLLKNPATFTLQELITLSGFFDMEPLAIINMVYEQHLADKIINNSHGIPCRWRVCERCGESALCRRVATATVPPMSFSAEELPISRPVNIYHEYRCDNCCRGM